MRQSIATGTTTARELGLGTIPVWSWLPAAEIESGALEQITKLAKLPSAVHVAVMLDCHVGCGMPIGAAVGTKVRVVPYAVGVDNSCGEIAVQTLTQHDAANVDC